MNEWLMFSIGILLGITIGIMLSNMLTSSKIDNLESEIGDLRIQRKLLKDEIQKITRRAKPQPRKTRKR